MVTYPALFEPDHKAGGFVVTFPDFGYGVTQGDSLEEAVEMAQDLLEGLISDRMEQGEDLPKPGKRRSRHYRLVSLPALPSARAELYAAFRASGMRKAELARRIGVAKSNLDRLFDLKHGSRFEQIEAAFAALRKHVWLEVRDAA